MCSSTPRLVTSSNRVGSAAIACSSGKIERHKVRHVVPSWRVSGYDLMCRSGYDLTCSVSAW
jgi:hypothetical protein